jgi:hypothetical protein
LVLPSSPLLGWPPPLDHLVIGPTGAWAIEVQRASARALGVLRPAA